MGKVKLEVALRSSTIPSGSSKETEVTVMDVPAHGVASMSREASIEVSAGVLLGRRYLLLIWKAGRIRRPRGGLIFNGRAESSTGLAGFTADTRSADSRGLTAPKTGSTLKDSRRFIPEGIWLGRYSF